MVRTLIIMKRASPVVLSKGPWGLTGALKALPRYIGGIEGLLTGQWYPVLPLVTLLQDIPREANTWRTVVPLRGPSLRGPSFHFHVNLDPAFLYGDRLPIRPTRNQNVGT